MITKTEAIKNFLNAKTLPELAALYTPEMEVQVKVAQDNGEPIEGEFKGHSWRGFQNRDTGEVWKPIRIPWKAASTPEYIDTAMSFELERHAEGIGLTGWNWVKRQSLWVGFDFDAIIGHSEKHEKRLSERELENVIETVQTIPWTTLRRSTSGSGLHLYVFLEPVATDNHTEHAALARAILGELSALTNYDFKGKVDTCGAILWIWHRKMLGTNGLTLIKEGTRLASPPFNWRDHLEVISGKRKRTLPEFIKTQLDDDTIDVFEEMCGQRSHVPLDANHRRLLDYIKGQSYCSWWDSDHHMLVTHTYYLKKAHEELSLKGLYETLSAGTEAPNDVNCFAYPLRGGGWVVRRYSRGVAEHPSWHQDSNGWTRCFYNRLPDFETACRTFGGALNDKGVYVFREAEVAIEAAKLLGVNLSVPNWAASRKAYLRCAKDNRLVFEFAKTDDDHAKDVQGFHAERRVWQAVESLSSESVKEPESQNFDDLIRHIVDEDGGNAGWIVKSYNVWNKEPREHIKDALAALGQNLKEIPIILGTSVFRPWILVNRPFEPEYPGDRMWNRDSAQFLYPPNLSDGRNFPHWLRILNHCGQGLSEAVATNEWCRRNSILTGGDYLKVWLASAFQRPHIQLPYLFLYGDQNTGKSIFYEALELIVNSNGIVEANNALTSKGNFNGEIANKVFCYVNEVDLGQSNRDAYNKIKNWVTAIKLAVHPKGKQQYMSPNTSHWIQVANNPAYCPIFPGDTRITMINVSPLGEIIPKSELLNRLKKEASDFIGEMLLLELPESNDRLGVPVIETEEKRQAEELTKTSLERFVSEFLHSVPGKVVVFKEFYDRFIEWVDPNEVNTWSKVKVTRSLPSQFVTGHSRRLSNIVCIANASWEPLNGEPTLPPLTVKEGKICGE